MGRTLDLSVEEKKSKNIVVHLIVKDTTKETVVSVVSFLDFLCLLNTSPEVLTSLHTTLLNNCSHNSIFQ
jgi:hypothetical protein